MGHSIYIYKIRLVISSFLLLIKQERPLIMDNIMIVKKRLKDLKSLSESLKASSQNDHAVDENLNIVKLIMDLTKDVNRGSLNQPQKNIEQQQNKYGTKIDSPEQKGSTILDQLINQTKNKKESERKKKQRFELKEQQYQKQLQLCRQQLEQVNNEKQNLQGKLKKMQQRNTKLESTLQKLKQAGQGEEQNEIQGKSLTSFQLSEPILSFTTKLTISEKDYSKIEYKMTDIKLGINFIQITNEKDKQKEDLTVKNDNRSSLKIDLVDLCDVLYIGDGDDCMLLKFGDDGDNILLFLRFNDFQSLHRWDIAIFTNLTIIKCLGKEKMFLETDIFESQKQKQVKKLKLISNVAAVKQDEQIEKLAQYRLKKLEEKSSLNENQKLELKQYFIQLQRISKLQSKLKQSGIRFKIEDDQETHKEDKRKQEKIDQYKKKQDEERKNQEQEMEARRRQISLQRKQEQKKQKQEQQKKKILELTIAKNTLKSGMFMTKYAEGAFNPHYKRVYLSTNEDNLCWKDKQSEQEKCVPITDILSVNYAQVGPGILKHVSKKDLGNLKCYVVIKLRGQKRKQLQFGMNVPQLMEDFAYNLTIFLNNLKQKKSRNQF